MYKSILPSIAFYACGSRGPRVFLTDYAEAEFKAFQKVFLSVCLSVCKIVIRRCTLEAGLPQRVVYTRR